MKTFFKLHNAPVPAWAAFALACASGTAAVWAQEAASAEAPKLEEAAPAKTEADYRNWFDLSVGGNILSGNRASFMQRHGLPADAYGGVDQLHYEQDVGQRGLFELDARGIFDNDDYSLRLNLEHPDYGYVRTGYREFRSWYDGSGGFLPNSGTFLNLYDDELYLDRGEYWFEAGLTVPDRPQFFFRYSHQFRDGRKDSTIWGDVGTAQRGVSPSFWDIEEERDTFQLDVKHSLSETDFGAGLRFENSNQNNSRNIWRRPFEAQDRHLTQREQVDTDLFNIRAFSETQLNETTLFTTGYAFTTLDTDLGGSRIYGADYDPIYDRGFRGLQTRDEGFFNLSGGSRLDQHVANLNLMLTPWDHVTIVPSFRVESLAQNGIANFREFNKESPVLVSEENFQNTSERDFVDVSEGLEIRYTGVTNWLFYTRTEWLQGEGDLAERQLAFENDLTPVVQNVSRDTESMRFTQKYAAGANWYPLRSLNFHGQYYFKSRQNDYDHPFDLTSNAGANRYPAFIRSQDFDTHDVNFRVTYRPLPQLTLVTRYDFQISTIDNRMDLRASVQGAESTTHIISESITWVPWTRLYLQGSIHYVLDETETAAQALAPGVVLGAQNDYVNGTAMAGYVLTEKTDLQAQYLFYKSDNYINNSAVSVPYLSGAEEHGATLAVIHRLSPAQQVTVRYGYFTSEDELYGGRNDYEAHMVSSTYRYRF